MDSGSHGSFAKDSAGYGLVQWTFRSRKQALLDYAHAVGTSIVDRKMQFGFLRKELESYAKVLKTLKASSTVKDASDIVLTQFERPANQSDAM